MASCQNANGHKIVDIQDIGLQKADIDFTNIKCDEHSGQFSCLFCKKCDSLVCPRCVSKVHKIHANDLIEISEAYGMKIDILKKGQNQLENGKASMTTKKNQLSRLKTTENSKHMKVRQDIFSHQKTLKTVIDNYFEKLGRELDGTRYQKVGKVHSCSYSTNPNTYDSIPKFIPGEIMQSDVGVLQRDVKQLMELSVNTIINKTFQTDLSVVTYFCPGLNKDMAMWIACDIDNKVKRVKPDGNKLKVLSSVNTEVYGMAILKSDDVLLSTGGSKLQKLNITTGKQTETEYNVNPFLSTAIHITSGNKVVVGGYSEKLGRRAVFVMNENGKHETVYEHDPLNQPIFKYSKIITSTRNGNVHVAGHAHIN
ncbi:uncharacterized protein [Mytilus edulis]|uniref:uncharacterized protein n=1 Tax=Mytilus edulis TaxID=6550 RepID=UPI0039F14CF0